MSSPSSGSSAYNTTCRRSSRLKPEDATAGPALGLCVVACGAKIASGCTSGNGLSGTAILSRASLAATGTFFATAIVVTLLIKAVI